MMCFGQKFTWKDRQKFRRKMLGYFQDATEERLASINAAIGKLDEQIARDEFLNESKVEE